MKASLPPIFAGLDVRYVQQHSEQEYSAECPQCGGEPHEDGEWPDRFRIFVDNHPRGWCRRCGYLLWPDQIGGDPPSAADLDKWRKEQIAREEARKRSAERALALLRDEARWERYHDSLDGQARAWWSRRGVPRSYQDYWQLGWKADMALTHKGKCYHSPSATIPLFDKNWECLNIKHRIITPPDGVGKYRYELAGQPGPLFRCSPEADSEHVIAIEGEIKAMVTHVRLDDSKACIVGIPGVTPGAEIIAELSGAERVTLVLDPGAKASGVKLARQIGIHKTWLLVTPEKIDDGILASDLSSSEVRRLLSHANKVDQFVQ